MRMTTVAAFAAFTLATGFAAGQAHAANATKPYSNVDKSNDQGNDTGDAMTDRLNEMQLQHPGTAGIPTATPPMPAGKMGPHHMMHHGMVHKAHVAPPPPPPSH